jgi:hypothetical protein
VKPWLLALAWLPFAAAWADTSSDATVANVSYSLVDLDPADGIAPAIQFNGASDYNSWAGTSLYIASMTAPFWSDERFAIAPSKYGALELESANALGAASASVSGDGTLSGTVLRASGHSTSSPTESVGYFAGADMLGNAQNAFIAQAFSLTPHTRVVFSADVRVVAQVSFSGLPAAGGQEGTNAYVELRVFEQGTEADPGPQFEVDEVRAWANGAGQTNIEERMAQVQFDNAGDTWLEANVNVNANVDGSANFYTPAVPEPGKSALFAGGLSAVAWRCRRRLSVTQPQHGGS